MASIIRFLRSIPFYFKKSYKMKQFKKNAEFGQNLDINHNAICHADHAGCIKIGNNCRIHSHLISQDDGAITIGDYCHLSYDTVIRAVDSVTIGDCVGISNHVHISDNNNHPTDPAIRRQMFMNGFDGDAWRWKHADSSPIVIEDNVWIGEYAAILKGVTIGKGSIVASYAVVTKDVPPYSIVAGNPARVVKQLEHEE